MILAIFGENLFQHEWVNVDLFLLLKLRETQRETIFDFQFASVDKV